MILHKDSKEVYIYTNEVESCFCTETQREVIEGAYRKESSDSAQKTLGWVVWRNRFSTIPQDPILLLHRIEWPEMARIDNNNQISMNCW